MRARGGTKQSGRGGFQVAVRGGILLLILIALSWAGLFLVHWRMTDLEIDHSSTHVHRLVHPVGAPGTPVSDEEGVAEVRIAGGASSIRTIPDSTTVIAAAPDRAKSQHLAATPSLGLCAAMAAAKPDRGPGDRGLAPGSQPVLTDAHASFCPDESMLDVSEIECESACRVALDRANFTRGARFSDGLETAEFHHCTNGPNIGCFAEVTGMYAGKCHWHCGSQIRPCGSTQRMVCRVRPTGMGKPFRCRSQSGTLP